MTINGKTYNVAGNPKFQDIDSKVSNTAMDGSVHGYFFGSHKRIEFTLEWLTAQERVDLEDARIEKVLLVMDNGEKYNVRLDLSAFEEIVINNEPVYNVSVVATEVVT